jgi:hydrogenase maturation protease
LQEVYRFNEGKFLKIAIVGAGTVIFHDEGVGVYAARYLEKNYTFNGDVTLVDGGVLGFQLMVYYQEYDRVIILDTITMKDDDAGAIYNLPAEQLLGLGSYKQTAHEVEIVEMLEICSLLDNMAETSIIGIVPADITEVVSDLTPTLKSRFGEFVTIALGELDKLGVTYVKNESEVTLEDIIESYANPKAQRDLQHLKGTIA